MILVKLVSEEWLVNVISAYAPQVDWSDHEKETFREQFDDQVRRITAREKIKVRAT